MNAVRPSDVPQGKILVPKENWLGLTTSDIEGAQPTYPHKQLHVFGPPPKDDVPGSKAKTHYPACNRPVDLSLRTDDIERARPNGVNFKTSRVTDPLTPRYDLPSFRERAATPPTARFHEGRQRDNMDNTGKTTPRILERNYARNPCEHRDIEGAQPNQRNRQERFPPRDNMKVVEQAGYRILSSKHHTPRMTNPMDPVYDLPSRTTHPFFSGEEKSAMAPKQAGHVEKSAPRVLHRDNGEPQASLIRRDVPGAVPQRYKGAVPVNIYDPPEITPYSVHLGLDCSDIKGAQTGTRMPGTR